jgi:hypothetical protein
VTGGFADLIGADAVEIGAARAEVGIEAAIESGEAAFGFGVRFERGIDDDFTGKCEIDAAFGEAEGKTGDEAEAVLGVESTVGESNVDGGFDGGGSGEVRDIELGDLDRLRDAADGKGEGGDPGFFVGHAEAGGRGAAGGDVFGREEVEVESGQGEAADETGDEHGGDEDGEEKEEEVVGGHEGRGGDEGGDEGEDEAGACEALAHAALESMGEAGPEFAPGVGSEDHTDYGGMAGGREFA